MAPGQVQTLWPCCKIGQGQPRVISWTNYDGPKAPMLHTKPQDHWPFGSGEDFYNIWAWTTAIFCHVTQTPWTNFRSPIPLRLHMKFGFDLPSGFGEDLWKWCTTDDRPWLYYKLTNEPKGSGELIRFIKDWCWLGRFLQNFVSVWKALNHYQIFIFTDYNF